MPNDKQTAKERSIALFEQCEAARKAALDAGKSVGEAHAAAKAIWNAWADPLIAEKKALEEAGKWDALRNFDLKRQVFRHFGNNDETRKWLEAAEVNLSSLRFILSKDSGEPERGESGPADDDAVKSILCEGQRIDFSGYHFPGDTFFTKAQFSGGDAFFRQAQFSGGGAFFSGAQFSGGYADFSGAQFSGGGADFERALFEGLANFKNTRFDKGASFKAIDVKRAFDLANGQFTGEVPNFIQAHFAEPPRLDNVEVPKVPFWRGARDRDEAARFSWLKKLAIAAHDHDREQTFFAGELRARRSDHPRKFRLMKRYVDEGLLGFAGLRREAVWSIPYDLISDFGRSVLRPIVLWFVLTGAFALAYATVDGVIAPKEGCPEALTSGLFLSLKNGLLLLGGNQRAELSNTYTCLYGGEASVPAMVGYLGIGQGFLSAILLFLVLLALRNLFKIK